MSTHMHIEESLSKSTLDELEDGLRGLQRNILLAPYTTFKIGGPADLFYEPRSMEDLARAVTLARELSVPYFLLGCGANILVGDGGFRGLVIHNAANRVRVDRAAGQTWVESGAIIYPDLIHLAVEEGLSGLEHYVGIPSTVGGAIWQNLHSLSPPPERERRVVVADAVGEAAVLTAEGDRRPVDAGHFYRGYDYSILEERDDIVLWVTVQPERGDREPRKEIMAADRD